MSTSDDEARIWEVRTEDEGVIGLVLLRKSERDSLLRRFQRLDKKYEEALEPVGLEVTLLTPATDLVLKHLDEIEADTVREGDAELRRIKDWWGR